MTWLHWPSWPHLEVEVGLGCLMPLMVAATLLGAWAVRR